MPHTPNFTAQLNNKAAVYEAAKRLGFTQTRGRGAGEGSPREMLEAIGAGNAAVVHVADDMWYDKTDELRALADEVAEKRGHMLAGMLRTFAASIDLAREMSEESWRPQPSKPPTRKKSPSGTSSRSKLSATKKRKRTTR